MTTATVPVDLLNPGQVFACLGFMEAAEILCGPCEGSFEYRAAETRTAFRISVAGQVNPIEEVLNFLLTAQAVAIAPKGAELDESFAGKWRIQAVVADSTRYPFGRPETPATLASFLFDAAQRVIPLNYWGDTPKSGRDDVKLWGGSGGKPGAALANDALKLIRDIAAGKGVDLSNDPFACSAPQTSSFRFDWRRDYIPLDAGFSPNKHKGHVRMVGYPLVELLAGIGLEHSRPRRANELTYWYGLSRAVLPTSFVRALLGVSAMNFPMRSFRMCLGWPGKEEMDRCITEVREENVR